MDLPTIEYGLMYRQTQAQTVAGLRTMKPTVIP